MQDGSTIAAIATARGEGGIAIVRVSGPRARAILEGAFAPAPGEISDRRLTYGRVVDAAGAVIDEAMAVFLPAPRTYTREDVAELQCHGGSVAARRTLARVLELGARPAEPGEFTKRAFLNGRIDLSRAEAVMQLVGANSEAAARASVRQLEGGVSGFVREISARILDLLSLIEASTDFPEEIDESVAAEQVSAGVREILSELRRRADPHAARLLREGASIVLAGRPNVGKSSLMNALLNAERAIVTPVPGTTRDVLTERICIGGVVAELSDTAGQRETADPVERIGVDRARGAVGRADIVLIVIDASEPLAPEDAELLDEADDRTIVCLNKADLPAQITPDDLRTRTRAEVLELSAATGEGVEALVKALEGRLARDCSEDSLTVERHLQLAAEAAEALEGALRALEGGCPVDIAALDLREAREKLSEITGEHPTEGLIDEIFARFCVGK